MPLLVDPSLDICPDYASLRFLPMRRAVAAGKKISEADTIPLLIENWCSTNKAQQAEWHRQQQLQQSPDVTPPANIPSDLPAPTPTKNAAFVDFADDSSVPNHILDRPSCFALQKIETCQYIELWYFTPEGCSDAKASSRLANCPPDSFRASRNALCDEDLSMKQISIAKTAMIQHMQRYNTSQKHVDALAVMFLQLEAHESRRLPYGDDILIIYQARVRREWYDQMKFGHSFNIGNFNNNLLANITQEYQTNLLYQKLDELDNINPYHTSSSSAYQGSSRMPCVRSPRRDIFRHQRNSRSRSPDHTHLPRNARARLRQRSPDNHNSHTSDRTLSFCVTCLGRHQHDVGTCRSTTLWNGSKARCT